QGRARGPHAGARGRAPRAPRLRGRPRRHEHPNAPGGLPRGGRLRSAGPADRRARARAAGRGRAPERPPPRRGPPPGGRSEMSAPELHPPLDFELPRHLEAHDPPEAAGRARDDVRMMVARGGEPDLVDARPADLARLLAPGDLLVINVSATLP